MTKKHTQLRRMTLGIVAVTATAILTLAGCSGGATSPDSTAPSGQGDTLTVAAPYGPNSLDPVGEGVDTVNAMYINPAYATLTHMNPNGEIVPDLATAWEYTDETTMLVTLRDGIKFADGTPITSQAVVDSLDYSRTIGVNKNWMSTITEVTAPSANTVEIKTSVPNDSLPNVLSQRMRIASIISPAGLANPELLKSQSEGAGAYVLDPEQSVAGDHYTYTPNSFYWDQSKIHWKKIVIKVAGSTTTALQAVQNGEADMMAGDATTGAAAEAAGLKVDGASYGLSGIEVMDRDGTVVPALKDVRVRQALMYAVDRDAISKAVYPGFSTPGAGMLLPGFAGYGENLDATYNYDPDKARSLLKEAGYADGFSFNVSASTIGNTDRMGQAIVQQWAEIGVKASLTSYTDGNQMFSEILAHKYPVTIFIFGALPTFIQSSPFITGGETPWNGFDSVDQSIIDTANSAAKVVGAESDKLYNEAWLKAQEEGYFSNVYTRQFIIISNADKVSGISIGGPNPTPNIAGDVVPAK